MSPKMYNFAKLYVRLFCMEKLIETIVSAIQDKKGKDIVSLDLSGFDGAICSNFVVCNADSTTQVAAIADGIEEKVLETLGENAWRVEGKQSGLWVAIDYIDVVVHIFQTELRGHRQISPELESVTDLMYALIRLVAERSGVATSVIASRDDLADYIEHPEQSRLREGWRFELVGSRLDDLLSGNMGLTVKDGKIELL